MSARVVRVQADCSGAFGGEWLITVERWTDDHEPSVGDVPADVIEALKKWIGAA